MGRSGYTDDCENVTLYRRSVDSAINGKRGQRFMVDLVEGLDAMETKRLITGKLVDDDCACALGVVALDRHLSYDFLDLLDNYEPEMVGRLLDVAPALAAEVMFENDEHPNPETPEERWVRMRAWAATRIVPKERG